MNTTNPKTTVMPPRRPVNPSVEEIMNGADGPYYLFFASCAELHAFIEELQKAACKGPASVTPVWSREDIGRPICVVTKTSRLCDSGAETHG